MWNPFRKKKKTAIQPTLLLDMYPECMAYLNRIRDLTPIENREVHREIKNFQAMLSVTAAYVSKNL